MPQRGRLKVLEQQLTSVSQAYCKRKAITTSMKIFLASVDLAKDLLRDLYYVATTHMYQQKEVLNFHEGHKGTEKST